MAATDTQRAIDAVWRIESARLIAGLARTELERAAALTRNARERELLLGRVGVGGSGGSGW